MNKEIDKKKYKKAIDYAFALHSNQYRKGTTGFIFFKSNLNPLSDYHNIKIRLQYSSTIPLVMFLSNKFYTSFG